MPFCLQMFSKQIQTEHLREAFCKKKSDSFYEVTNSHLSLLDSHRLAPGCHLLVDAGQKILGDPQGIQQEWVVRMAGGCVFEQVLAVNEGTLT